MERESSPEEGEILEEGEVEPSPEKSQLTTSSEPGELADSPSKPPPASRLIQADARGGGKHTTHEGSKASQRPSCQRDKRRSDVIEQHDKVNKKLLVQIDNLANSIVYLASRLSLKYAKRDAKQHCADLEECLYLLVELSKLSKNWQELIGEPGLTVKGYAAKTFAGLRALHIMSNTGLGRSVLAGRQAAVSAVQIAHDNIKLFPPACQEEFHSWRKNSKVFASLLQPLATQDLDRRVPPLAPPPVLPAPAGIKPFAVQSSRRSGLPSSLPVDSLDSFVMRANPQPRAPSQAPPIVPPKALPGGTPGAASGVPQRLPPPIVLPTPKMPQSRFPLTKGRNNLPGKQGSPRRKGKGAVQKPRPPPGSPPSVKASTTDSRTVEPLPPTLAQKLAAYRRKFLNQQKQNKSIAQVREGLASSAPVPSSSQVAELPHLSAIGMETSMGVPGLDLGIPQAAEQSAPSKKRPHPSEEDIISLEDEIDLYSFGPSPASLAAASEGAELLSSEVTTVDHIPGIDMPKEQHKRAKMQINDGKLAKDVEEQNADFDDEVNRLFGDVGDTDNGSGEEEEEADDEEEEGDVAANAEAMDVHQAQEELSNGQPGTSDAPEEVWERGGDQGMHPASDTANGHADQTTEAQTAEESADELTPVVTPVASPRGEANAVQEDPPPAVLDLLRQGKLCLVLDLDHTLLNSARWGEMDHAQAANLEEQLERQEKMAFDDMQLHSIEDIQMWTKLRPSCRAFLKALSQKFTMWIHTNGNRHYAGAICSLLDPTKELFGDRVVANAGVSSTEGATAAHLIKRLDAQGLKGLEPITMIVDDSATVWPGHNANLVQVERYCYFPNATKQFGYSRVSLLESCRDESPDHGMLSVVQQVLLKTHEEVMRRYSVFRAAKESKQPVSLPSWDVRLVLSYFRAQILRNTKILFSRLWHVGEKAENQPYWVLALQLGAECTTTLDESVTHVVTNTKFTEKAHWAAQHGKAVVSNRWLEGSSILWKRADERSFPVIH